MANSYTWIIRQLECYRQYEGQPDVVFNIHWRRQAIDENGNVGDAYGSQAVTFDNTTTFTPFDQLTKDEVISWLEASIGADRLKEIDADLDKQISDQVTPAVIRPTLPW